METNGLFLNIKILKKNFRKNDVRRPSLRLIKVEKQEIKSKNRTMLNLELSIYRICFFYFSFASQ